MQKELSSIRAERKIILTSTECPNIILKTGHVMLFVPRAVIKNCEISYVENDSHSFETVPVSNNNGMR